ncbi:hypothetical protein Tco_1407394 [Tanacetum coccineum]
MLERGPYEFRIFTPSKTEAPRLQKEEDLRGDDLKYYKAEIEAMNLILISIITRSTINQGSSSRTTIPYYVTHPSSVVDYDDDYQGDVVQNNSDDPLTYAMIWLARDRVNIQSRNFGNDGRNTRRSHVQEEVIEGTNVQNDAGNIQRTLQTSSSGTVANV